MFYTFKDRLKTLIQVHSLALICSVSAALAAQACAPTYTVVKGDTLSGIAEAQLGSVFALETLYEANRAQVGPNPDLIAIGMSLKLPCTDNTVDTLDWSVMPRAETLASLLKTEDIQVLDIRSPKRLAEGVIPGAISVPFSKWRGPKDNPGRPPAEEALAELIGGAGLDLEQPIIIIHHKANMMDIGRAASVYWLLKSSGARSLAILRDGHTAWKERGLPIALKPTKAPARKTEVRFSKEWRANVLDVYGVATDQIDGYLLDARPHSMFSRVNKLGQAIASTLPGAQNTPVKSLMEVLSGKVDVEDDVEDIIDFLKENNVDWTNNRVISFCHAGELAALNWFYASEVAELDNMMLFPESVKGWAHLGGNLAVGQAG